MRKTLSRYCTLLITVDLFNIPNHLNYSPDNEESRGLDFKYNYFGSLLYDI
jgi:hypothetical protein